VIIALQALDRRSFLWVIIALQALDRITSPQARSTTLQLVPRSTTS
jgi:hypothetical protein